MSNVRTTMHRSSKPMTSVVNDEEGIVAEEDDDLADIERELWLEDEKEMQMSTSPPDGIPNTDDDEPDINLVAETEMDRSIAMAVKSLLDEGPKEPELSPVEKFNQIYRVRARGELMVPPFLQLTPLINQTQGIKSREKDGKTLAQLDSAAMLADLFSDSQKKDPFDERKVMMKLRKMLEEEDFQDLFKDPNVGDIY